MPKKPSHPPKEGTKPKQPQSAIQLVAIADEAMQSLDVHTAMIHYQQAVPLLENQDNHEKELAAVLAKLAECKACLYLYVGQLSSDEEALEAHRKGIHELEQCIAQKQQQQSQNSENGASNNGIAASNGGNTDNNGDDGTTLADLQLHLVRAHCALAELYLTDLCFEENAEQECESHVQKALQLCDPPLVDALQAMASLRLSQQKDATTYILQAYQNMKTGCEALAALVGLKEEEDDDNLEGNPHDTTGAMELTEVDAVNSLPGFEFRCQTAKLLLECAATTESTNMTCVQAAIHVLGSLLAENDEIVEIWFLLGCAFDLLESPRLAQHYWQQALDMLLKVQEQLKQDAEDDDDDDDVLEELNACEGQIGDIRNKLERIEQSGDLNQLDADEMDVEDS
ncbi:hypothetical protein MHU86_15837 [Fragilaria crotonensis]|nr:hypothetical protein MHU86_15837 [Fragilaria crotonensis]